MRALWRSPSALPTKQVPAEPDATHPTAAGEAGEEPGDQVPSSTPTPHQKLQIGGLNLGFKPNRWSSAGLTLLGICAVATVWTVSYPAAHQRTWVNGQAINVSFGAANDIHNGKQLSGLSGLLPCSVRVNMDLRWQPGMDLDAWITWNMAHEIGHCMERQLPGGSRIDAPQIYSEGSLKNRRSEAYADAWASLYMARCGIDLTPLGWAVEGDPAQPSRATIESRQGCVPKPEEAVAYQNPITVIGELRRHAGLMGDGRTARPAPQPKGRKILDQLSTELGIDLNSPPPATFAQAALHWQKVNASAVSSAPKTN